MVISRKVSVKLLSPECVRGAASGRFIDDY